MRRTRRTGAGGRRPRSHPPLDPEVRGTLLGLSAPDGGERRSEGTPARRRLSTMPGTVLKRLSTMTDLVPKLIPRQNLDGHGEHELSARLYRLTHELKLQDAARRGEDVLAPDGRA